MAKNYIELEVRVNVKDVITKRLANLLSVKSIVTLILTFVFAYKVITGQPSQEFMNVYMAIIAFYFGVQAERVVQQQLTYGNEK